MIIIYLLLSGYAIYSFINYKYINFLFAFLGLVSRFFMLDRTGGHQIGCDFAIVVGIILFFYSRKREVDLFMDPYSKWVKIILLFYCIEFIYTIVSSAESLNFALKVLRMPLILFAFYSLRVIPLEDWNSFFRKGLYLVLFQGLLYYFQFAGIYLLAGYNKEYGLSLGTSAAINIPRLSFFYIFYCLINEDIKYRYLIILFLISLILMTFIRGSIIALGIGIVFYLYTQRNRKQTILILLISIVLIPFAINNIEKKSSLNHSTSNDIAQVLSGDFRNIDETSGTFSFRTAMLVERFEYLRTHPQYLLQGVGMIHEYSPKCWSRFDFRIGTFNEGAFFEQCQIESGDNTWVPILLRYGIIGVILHLLFFVIALWDTWRRLDWTSIFFPIFLILLLTSFESALFERTDALAYAIMYLSLLASTYNPECSEYLEYAIDEKNISTF